MHPTKIVRIVFDRSLTGFETLHAGGGSGDELIELRLKGALALTDGIVADIAGKG